MAAEPAMRAVDLRQTLVESPGPQAEGFQFGFDQLGKR
jgi:hypothetical protein